VLVTHPEWSPTFYSAEAQKELSSRGNVVFERCFVSTTRRCGFVPFETIERAISDVGVGTTVLSSDNRIRRRRWKVCASTLSGYAALVFQWTIFAR
jgi:hypothetical protein